jgi:hypothetical protein
VDPDATPSLADLKKAEKQRAKKERKAQAGEAMESESDAAYDFSVDFWKNPMTRATNNTNDGFQFNNNTNAASSTSAFGHFNQQDGIEVEEESSEDDEDDDEEEDGERESDEESDDDVR